MTNRSKPPHAHKAILSDETTTAILDKYMRLYGPCTEERLAAILQMAIEAAGSLTCFQMTMRGELVPDLKSGSVVFRNAPPSSGTLEPVGDILQRVLREAGL
jgi:hypothetical protein